MPMRSVQIHLGWHLRTIYICVILSKAANNTEAQCKEGASFTRVFALIS